MSFILSYTSVAYTKKQSGTRFGGSSRFRVVDDELIEVSQTRKTNHVAKRRSQDKESQKRKTDKHEIKQETGESPKTVKRVYRLNKSKVRKKCYAMCRLKKSKEFMAFYTITFPQGLTDELCYKLFNTWLTRCRKSAGLTSYLWVAERQKNGTIHYHLLTNDYMKIGEVNR